MSAADEEDWRAGRWAWADEVEKREGYFEVSLGGPKDRLYAASILLHGQPFGFTWEDVDRNRWAARHWQATLDAQGPEPTWDFGAEEMEGRRLLVEWHNSIADRIAALLPPREP